MVIGRISADVTRGEGIWLPTASVPASTQRCFRKSPETQLVAERHRPALPDRLMGHNGIASLLAASRGTDPELDPAGIMAKSSSPLGKGNKLTYNTM